MLALHHIFNMGFIVDDIKSANIMKKFYLLRMEKKSIKNYYWLINDNYNWITKIFKIRMVMVMVI